MPEKLDRSEAVWIAVVLFLIACLAVEGALPWVKEYPESLVVPLTEILNAGMGWFVEATRGFFRGISWFLGWPVLGVQSLLHWLPWPVTIALAATVAHAAAGWRLAVFACLGLAYMVVVGYWYESMNSLSLVAISVPLAILIGFAFGVLGYFSRRAERIIMPALDLLQTVPTFAYLIPILMLFGFGTVVGLIASLLYSFPPMVRNTILGLRRVPAEVIESGLMSGATTAQLFWRVQVPSAQRQILLGVNQATMASLSMVIIASIIGGSDDIGWEVLSTMRKAQFGESLLAGIVIALLAMIMDRVTSGLALKESDYAPETVPFLARHKHWAVAGMLFAGLLLLAQVLPFLKDYPKEWVVYPAAPLNDAVEYAVVNYRSAIETLKTVSFFFLMLPARIGLQQTVSPFTWGFELTFAHSVGYALLVAALAAAAFWRGSNSRLAIATAIFGIVYYFGLTNVPWPAVILLFTVMSWQVGGWKLGVGTFLGVGYLLVTGIWTEAMLSLYLCGLAVIVSFTVGSVIGIWAAHSDRVSAFVRPISDTLQTMPLFVILIPIVMLFKIGEFTALLAIIAYAFVPAIRYAEHGLRNLPHEVLEAATAMGCTRRQLLLHVKLPLALPVLMLGLNQTIMYGMAMLVIAALVGTSGLGQRVYIGLSDGNFGVGMIAGIGMAVIAIIADRLTQAWSRNRQEALGLA